MDDTDQPESAGLVEKLDDELKDRPYPRELMPQGIPYTRSADLDDYLEEERERNAPK